MAVNGGGIDVIGDLGAKDATALAGLVAAGEVSASELLDAALAAVRFQARTV